MSPIATDEPHRWASAKEAANRIGVHERTVIRWCRGGAVHARQLPGGRWRVGLDGYGWPVGVRVAR